MSAPVSNSVPWLQGAGLNLSAGCSKTSPIFQIVIFCQTNKAGEKYIARNINSNPITSNINLNENIKKDN